MPIEDYIPNVFGQAPMGYEGLLGAERTQGLQKTANLQGLLGAAGALAQGLSAQGPRRSALQNILGAIGGGFQGSQGAYQQGLQQYSQQQQLGMQQRQLAGAEQLKLKYPDLATMIDTNLPGAMRIIADMEQEKRQPKLTSAKPGETLVSPTGEVVYQAAAAPTERKTAVVDGVLVDTQTGMPIYGTAKQPEAKVPTLKDFPDGTMRQYDPASGSWKTLARKPAGEGATMYEKKPTVDANGKLVFLPTRAGLPVLDAATAKPVDYQGVVPTKPIPPVIQKAEDLDYEKGQSAINLATDANKYLTLIKSGAIKFGPLDKLSTSIRGAFGSESPDVTARNDFESFKTRLINESLRLNKGTQTEGDAVRSANELRASDSMEGASKAISTLLDLNVRAAKDAQNSIIRRRKNAKLGDPDVLLDIPQFEPHVFSDSDYRSLKSGTTFVDPKGVRRVKP